MLNFNTFIFNVILQKTEYNDNALGAIVLNSTAEFCRTLGDIPTYGKAGNREEEEDETLMVNIFYYL